MNQPENNFSFEERLKQFIIYVAPYAKRFLLMLKSNILYIIWFALYYYGTILSLKENLKEKAGTIATVFYVITFFIAFFAGDTIIKWIEGARPVETNQEKEYLHPIFKEVYEDIKSQIPALPSMKLHIIDNMSVNAMAIGRHCIAVTQGAIDTFTEDELKGVLAHEMSHIYHGDTSAVIINIVGNGVVTANVLILKLILKGFEYFARLIPDKPMQKIVGLIQYAVEIYVFILLLVGTFILSIDRRKKEFKADKFAFETGYGKELIEALYVLQKVSLEQKFNLITKMKASHPRVSKSIEQLEILEGIAIDGQ